MAHLDRSDPDAVDHFGEIAELGAGKHADFDPALSLLADQLGELGRVAGLRFAFRTHMGVAERDLLLGESGA